MRGRGWRKFADWVRGGPPDTEIGESVFHHDVRIVEISAVDDDGVTESLIKPGEIE
jgi:hypothetical protein